jgi:hypothetical protein
LPLGVRTEEFSLAAANNIPRIKMKGGKTGSYGGVRIPGF